MQNNQLNNYKDDSVDSGLLLREYFFKYARHWKWFLLATILFFSLAKLYLRYSIPQYKAVTSILIKDDKSGGLSTELSAFEDLGLFSGSSKNIDDEIEILKSRSLIEKTVKRGNFNLNYIAEGRIKSSDVYGAFPISVNFLNKDERFYAKDTLLVFNVISNVKYELLNQKNDLIGTYQFGDTVNSPEMGAFVVEKKVLFNEEKEIVKFDTGKITLQVVSLKDAVEGFKAKLNVSMMSKHANVVELSAIDPVSKKAEDFLDLLVDVYNEDAIKDKNIISQKTAEFINDRLQIITKELEGVELTAEDYKQKNKITDLVTEAELNLKSASEYNTEGASVDTQIKVVDVMLDYVKKTGTNDIIPANIIPSDQSSSSFIAEYNALLIEKSRLLKSSTEENPTVVRLTEKINTLKSTIKESLNKLKTSLVQRNKTVSKEEGTIAGRISQIPRQEREFRSIFRQQQIKEELYLYLFKKREETAISLAATAPTSKVVDRAFASESPISPKRQLIYILALAFGFLIPFAILYLKDLFDTKVKAKEDIMPLNIPFLGDVPHSDSNNEIIQSDSRTSTAEAIRIVRTNLEFVLNSPVDDRAKTIFVTSTIPGEGKTFVAANLATTIAISGKKVLLIGLDVRNPKIDEYFHVPSRGVTNYLTSQEGKISNYLLKQQNYDHFDILPSGVIPPNPAELLMNVKLEKMFDELKESYDYIVVDTAPVSLVTDTLLIAKNADAFVYVVRSNYLEKELLKIPSDLYKDKKLPNMSIVLNDTDIEKGYGYGYGYGQTVEKKNWIQKITEKFKS